MLTDNHCKYAWEINSLHLFIKIKNQFTSTNYKKIIEEINSLDDPPETTQKMIALSELYGINGPLIASLSKDFYPTQQEAFKKLYDFAVSEFTKVFVENSLSNWHKIIEPVVIDPDKILQDYSKIYFEDFCELLINISSNWNMAGKCHSTRGVYNRLHYICNNDDTTLKTYVTIMTNALTAFSIPFEHIPVSNGIIIVMGIIENLYRNNISMDNYIGFHKQLYCLLSSSPSHKVLLLKFSQLSTNFFKM